MALFPVWAGMFMGLGRWLVAVALWQSAEYARIFAAHGIMGASMCVVRAGSDVLGFTVPLPLWPVGPAINAVWITLLAALMLWCESPRPPPRRPAREETACMEITTKRFVLREFTDEDGPAFLAYQSDPRYTQFCGPADLGVDRPRALLRQFREWAAERPRRNYQLAISGIRHPQELMGCCGLRCEGYGPDQAEMGIELAPRYWGRYAYALEVASALIDFGFTTLGLSEVRGVSVSANSRVTRLAHRYGFVPVGRRPGSEWMRARGWHHTEWQLTRERWEVFQSSDMRSNRRRSPEPLLRPSPALGNDAEIPDPYDPHLGYDGEKFP